MITPRGFFQRFLKTQMDGLTGHIAEAGYPFDVVEWGKEDYHTDRAPSGWWPYEQVGYWFDGYTRAAILLQDKEALKNARRIVKNVLDHADEDGYLGPAFMKDTPGYRWPHAVFFRAWMALADEAGDAELIDALARHYMAVSFENQTDRDVMNVETLCWVYERTGEQKFLDKAEELYRLYNEDSKSEAADHVFLDRKKPFLHGVTYNEGMKLGALLYRCTGKKEYLKISERGAEKLESFFMLPGGVHCSEEYVFDNNYFRCYETCDVTDFSWALSCIQKASGKPIYGDRIERCVFNGGMGSVLEDFRALQYFSCANQVIATHNSSHCRYNQGNTWMSYRPNPGTECCPGNVNRFLPNYVLNMWRTEGEKVYCDLYGASRYETEVNGQQVIIEEETNWPFAENMHFSVRSDASFQLVLRFPSYYQTCELSVNGHQVPEAQEGLFVIDIQGDAEIILTFTSEIETHRVKNGVYFTKGLFTYSLGMKGDRRIDREEKRSSEAFPAYDLYPDQHWGYGIPVDGRPQFYEGNAKTFDLKDKELPYIEVDARKIKNEELAQVSRLQYWMGEQKNGHYTRRHGYRAGKTLMTPDLLRFPAEYDEAAERIRLYPYGACKLRVTVFPEVDR